MKKRILTAVAAVVLVCAIFAMGTLAYLTAKSNDGNAIVNTFVASEGLIDDDPGDGMVIKETDVNNTSSTTTSGNEYSVLPGVDITKDAHIVITGKTEIKSYLYVEVVKALDSKLTCSISADWKELSGVTGKNGGTVYVYKNVVSEDVDAYILKDNKISVGTDYTAEDGGSISFYGYLCQQATFEAADATEAAYKTAAATAYNTCF